VRLRALVACAALGALLGGCASVAPHAPSAGASAPEMRGDAANPPRHRIAPAMIQLCELDSLLWSQGFVPRAMDRACASILESVTLADE